VRVVVVVGRENMSIIGTPPPLSHLNCSVALNKVHEAIANSRVAVKEKEV
jgi:hypothetical protein